MSALPQEWRDCSHGHVAIQWDAFMHWACPLCHRTEEIEQEIEDLKSDLQQAQGAAKEAEGEADDLAEERDATRRRVGVYSMALQDLLSVSCPHDGDCGKDKCDNWAEHRQARKALDSE